MKLAELPRDTLPSRFLADRVELTDIRGDGLREPFYDQALARLREDGRLRVALESRVLGAWTEAERLPGARGLVFHVGRCGSTLLANMLGAHPDARVVKEPEVLNQALLAGSPRPVVQGVLRGFSRGLPAEGGLVVKCTSWNATGMTELLEASPDAAAVFLWRPAAEVVASCLDTEPAWGDWRQQPQRLADWLPGVDGGSERAAFYSAAWRSVAEAALAAVERFGDRVRIVSYAALRDRPRDEAVAAARHFGLAVDEQTGDLLGGESTRYSKDPSGKARFDPGGSHRRRGLDEGQLAEVVASTADAETALAAHRAN